MLTNNISYKSLPRLFLSLSLLSILSLSLFFFFFFVSNPTHQISQNTPHYNSINVYVADLPRSYNYDLLNLYWTSSSPDSRIPSDPDHTQIHHLPHRKYPPYPENPLIKQYSAEYWLLGDLETQENSRPNSFANRVFNEDDADVVFVPFFATLSAEMELAKEKSLFRKKTPDNEDYKRQREVVDLVKNSRAWKRLGGRDHVFVLTGHWHCLADPVAMWHVRADIAPAILLVVDFGGWFRLDSKSKSLLLTPNGNSSEMVLIQHTQVSLLKDVIVPYTHLLPRLELKHNQKRRNLLYFKGAKHRHRGGLVREKLWDLLVNESRVIMEEGFPNATGREQSITGMRSSEFCLHPAGDTPTSCRLFDAIQSLCIPVIVSDNIELPFEGITDYSEFSVFVAVSDALIPSWLVAHLRSFSRVQRDKFRRKMAEVQPMFVYDNGHADGMGPIHLDGAVNQIWRKIHQKLPVIKESIARDKRKPQGVSNPLRCHCT